MLYDDGLAVSCSHYAGGTFSHYDDELVTTSLQYTVLINMDVEVSCSMYHNNGLVVFCSCY
jgi:hypothetical protein